MNLVDRPTVDVTELNRGEKQAGIKRALRIIRTCKAERGLLHRKDCVQQISQAAENVTGAGRRKIGNARVYLMQFPIRGPAQRIRVET